MASKEKPTLDQITEQTIAEWKSKHPVFEYRVSDGSKEYRCFFRKPDRTIIAFAQTKSAEPIKSNEYIAQNCFLGGDKEILEEDKFFFGLQEHLSKLIERVSGELVEL